VCVCIANPPLPSPPSPSLIILKAIETHGVGLSSVRFICGTQDIHKKLEDTVSKFHKKEDTILYASCFDANAGIFETLLSADDAVISDELNHASIIDGIRLCKAVRYRYKHRNMDDLEDQLKKAQDQRFRIIATDGVFSMDGNVAPLPDICDLAEKYDAMVFIDECHATGFFGPTGRGTAEHFGVEDRIDIINSTLGKAMGGATGGYTSASKEVVDLLRQKSRPYLFSNSIAPSVVSASQRAYDMITEDSSLVQKLQGHIAKFRDQLTAAGFTVLGDHDHPICPVLLKDARLASEFADAMLKKGIYVIGFSFPVVPRGQARIRVQLSAAHEPEHVDHCIASFIEVGKELGVIA
jgi:glycine C-acetyltransferase